MRVINKDCPKCEKRKPASEFANDRTQPSKLACWCKECTRQNGKRLYDSRKLRGVCVTCGGIPRDGLILCDDCNTKTKSHTKKTYWNLKNKILLHYCQGTPKCMCPQCPITAPELLTVDHIKGGGRKHIKSLRTAGGTGLYQWIKKNNFPPGFQILCGACNMSKSGRLQCARAGLKH